mmetsp:Transcript_13891/g.49312  ORF Transcript_13891/g.49312 Transcript_13891/m.49312 type:complete len:217 (-) Transcript_13891:411-1061(-)
MAHASALGASKTSSAGDGARLSAFGLNAPRWLFPEDSSFLRFALSKTAASAGRFITRLSLSLSTASGLPERLQAAEGGRPTEPSSKSTQSHAFVLSLGGCACNVNASRTWVKERHFATSSFFSRFRFSTFFEASLDRPRRRTALCSMSPAVATRDAKATAARIAVRTRKPRAIRCITLAFLESDFLKSTSCVNTESRIGRATTAATKRAFFSERLV